MAVNRPEVNAQPSSDKFYKAITGQNITATTRRGKFLIINLRNENRIILQLRIIDCLLVTSLDYLMENHTHIISN
ncbi:DNA-formamidopyrimidine glycosylase family protein [Eubacterium sp. 14-2]|uniref:DNA-formamidopyrimidine glycosylase family protein n=1 Tax=Eubacterium sp. 14-2 TaxID=1235790 RepID=UPI0009DBC2C4